MRLASLITLIVLSLGVASYAIGVYSLLPLGTLVHLDVVRALEKTGFAVVRQGEHIVMSDGTSILTIPRHLHDFGDSAASAAPDTDE